MDDSAQDLKRSIKHLVEQQRVAHKLLAVFYKQLFSIFHNIGTKYNFTYDCWWPTYLHLPKSFRKSLQKDWIWDWLPLYCSRVCYLKQLCNKRCAGLVFALNCDEGFRPENRNVNTEINPIELQHGVSTVEILLYIFDNTVSREDFWANYEVLPVKFPDSKNRNTTSIEIPEWYPKQVDGGKIWFLCFKLESFLEEYCKDKSENLVLAKIDEMIKKSESECSV